jgi:hypothetical protein
MEEKINQIKKAKIYMADGSFAYIVKLKDREKINNPKKEILFHDFLFNEQYLNTVDRIRHQKPILNKPEHEEMHEPGISALVLNGIKHEILKVFGSDDIKHNSHVVIISLLDQ